MTVALFVLAAGVGAVGRHVVAQVACSWHALLGVNVAGSALLGWIVTRDVSTATVTVVGVGFCGTLTTFGSFALEVKRLGPTLGAAYAAVTIGCCCGAAALAATF